MNTYVQVTLFDAVDRQRAEHLIDLALGEIHRIESLASDYSDTTDIGRVNLAAGKDSVTVSREITDLVRLSMDYSRRSEGAFDITIGPLVKAWNFLAERPTIPDSAVIASLLNNVGVQHINVAGNRIHLAKRGMALDLGGIAKGYAVDRAAIILREQGATRFIVDIGGNLGVFWDGTRHLDSTVAEIMVRHPRHDGAYIGSFRMGSGGVATSGDYQRCFMIDGVRYHHILVPTTGFPARGVVSVTVVANDATTADAYSTLVFVLGKERGFEMLQHTPGIDGLIIYEEHNKLSFLLTPGLEKRFVPLND